jgi:hypothetical protein
MSIAGICELVLETDEVDRLQDFYEGLGLSRLLAEDEDRIWDFFQDGAGAEDGVMALAEDGDGA